MEGPGRGHVGSVLVEMRVLLEAEAAIMLDRRLMQQRRRRRLRLGLGLAEELDLGADEVDLVGEALTEPGLELLDDITEGSEGGDRRRRGGRRRERVSEKRMQRSGNLLVSGHCCCRPAPLYFNLVSTLNCHSFSLHSSPYLSLQLLSLGLHLSLSLPPASPCVLFLCPWLLN